MQKNKAATKNLNLSVFSCHIESCESSRWAQFWAQWVIWLTNDWRVDQCNSLKTWCRRGELNPHGCCHPPDFESGASANSATPANSLSSFPAGNKLPRRDAFYYDLRCTASHADSHPEEALIGAFFPRGLGNILPPARGIRVELHPH